MSIGLNRIKSDYCPTTAGFLIAVEGIDGSGKSSLVRALNKVLEQHDIDTLVTKEPGGTTLGQELRVILHEKKENVCDMAEYFLFAADRAQHFETVVIPALKQNKVIISDRLDSSSVAYQGYGRGLNREMIKQTNAWAMKNVQPDLIFYIKLDFKTALERIMRRGGKLTSFETEQELFWQRVNKGFDELFENKKNVMILDGKKTLEELTQEAAHYVLERVK